MTRLTAFTIGAVFAMQAANGQVARQAERSYQAAQHLYAEGVYQGAADSSQQALFLFEKSSNVAGQVKALNLLGEAKANLGKCEEALLSLNKSLQVTLAHFRPISAEVSDVYYYLSRAQGGCARDFGAAIPNMHRSISIKRKLYGERPETALSYTSLGYFYYGTGEFDSAAYYLNKSLVIQKKYLAPDDVELSNTLYHLGRNCQEHGDLSQALAYLRQSSTIRLAKLNHKHPNISNSLQQLGSVYQKMGNVDRALDYYKQSLNIRIKSLGPKHVNVAASYWSIGNLYGNVFNYPQAVDYIRQGNATANEIYEGKSDILPTYEALLGKMYGKMGDHSSALVCFGNAQRNAEKNVKPDHLYMGIVYNIVGEYHADNGEYVRARSFLDKALLIFRQAGGGHAVREADVVAKLGLVNAGVGRFDLAKLQYKQALDVYHAKMGAQNSKVATVHQYVADVYVAQNKFDSALSFYQKSLAALAPHFEVTDLFVNPAAISLENNALALRIINKKAQALSTWFEHSRQPFHLVQSLNMYLYAIELATEILSGFELESSKAELNREVASLYKFAMETSYQLYSLSRDKQYIEAAFLISEKSKAILLLENIRDKEAKLLAGVPDSLVRKEHDLEIALAYHQSQLHNAKSKQDAAAITLQDRAIFDVQGQLSEMRQTLEKRFPAYFNIRHHPIDPSLATAQKALPENTFLLEYFTGERYIYAFGIGKDTVSFLKIQKNDKLLTSLNDYQKSLTNADFIVNSGEEADRLYAQSASRLYDLLVKPMVAGRTGFNQLVVIPDGELAQLNFGTLLVQSPSGLHNYKSLDYAINRWRISYAYSASWLLQSQLKKKGTRSDFAGFAPSYSVQQFTNMDTARHPLAYLAMRSGQLPLPGAVKEVEFISQLMQGDSWINERATETNFKTSADRYDVLHLAMHTLLDNENPQYSELLLNRDQENDGYLTVAEIYNLKLSASMVVLSACSSGFGKMEAGEGPISISRAFSYAGSPSVVMSFWKVPDEVTRQIMTTFYEELKKGAAKDEALRLAQLKFLQETTDPIYQHPYFWAGIVVMGDSKPLVRHNSGWIYVALIGSVVMFAIVLIWQRRRHRAT
jgi:CHAT domain-containing protein